MTSIGDGLCLCGCGQPVVGERSTRRYFSPACRVKRHRHGGPKADSKVPPVAENRPQPARAVSQHGGVTLRDTDVRCAGCRAPMPKLEGPLPVLAYCGGCAASKCKGTLSL